MTEKNNLQYSYTLKIMVIIASFVVIVAGMKAAHNILVPFLLAVFIAIITSPFLYWLNRKKINMGISLLIVIFCVLMAALLVGYLIGNSIKDFTASIPEYQKKLSDQIVLLSQLLSKMGISFSDKELQEYINPGAAVGFASKILTSLLSLLKNAFFIIITVIFILFEAATFPAKMNKAFGGSKATADKLKDIMEKINHYMVIKTYISLGTGILVAIWLLIIKVDYPFLWGLLAFMFNFIPNVGSILAAVPAVLVALVQLGPTAALLAAGGYVILNVAIGNFIEPRYMGSGLGLSTLIVFLSLVFWGWILGPIGMLLSVPLTMTMKIALSSSEETAWISTLLGGSIKR